MKDRMGSYVNRPDGPCEAFGHSAGPWNADECGVRNRSGYICQINRPTRFDGQDERYAREVAERTADARLIAAAPDLLAALKGLDEFWSEDFPLGPDTPSLHYSMISMWRQIRAAIAKAEGA